MLRKIRTRSELLPNCWWVGKCLFDDSSMLNKANSAKLDVSKGRNITGKWFGTLNLYSNGTGLHWKDNWREVVYIVAKTVRQTVRFGSIPPNVSSGGAFNQLKCSFFYNFFLNLTFIHVCFKWFYWRTTVLNVKVWTATKIYDTHSIHFVNVENTKSMQHHTLCKCI